MKAIKTTTALLAGALLAIGASGCVDQEPSMSLTGSLLFEGEINEDGFLVCEIETDPGSAEFFSSRAQLDISEWESTGQPGPPVGSRDFVFWAGITNLLEQSTQVGAGGGGGGDNFQGLKEDQNFIQITGAEVRFPSELNDFAGGDAAGSLEKKELFSAVMESNGGGVVVSFPLFGGRQVSDVKAFYDAARQASGVALSDQAAIVPLVAEIQIKGETFSGREVESNKFQYPIDICGNCELSNTRTCYVPPE